MFSDSALNSFRPFRDTALRIRGNGESIHLQIKQRCELEKGKLEFQEYLNR